MLRLSQASPVMTSPQHTTTPSKDSHFVHLTITQLILSWNDRTTHCDLLAVHAFQEQEEVQAASLLLCVSAR